MFKWVKNLFSSEKPAIVEDKYVASDVIPVAAEKPKPLVLEKEMQVKEAAKPKAKKHTKASLGKLTKANIDALAKSELGVDLDRRKTKDAMIKDFLAAQKK